MLNTTLHKKKKATPKPLPQITISKYINDRFALKSLVLGTGSFGDVQLGEETDPITKQKREVAIKKVRLEKYYPEYLKYLMAEIDIMAQCQCENIVSLIDKIQVSKRELYLVIDLCEGDFKQYMRQVQKRGTRQKRAPLLSEKEIQYFLKQIALGLRYLHAEKKVCHRDIKPHNLLLKKKGGQQVFNYYSKFGKYEDYTVLISDFGLSKVLEGDLITGTILGTKCYKSPQIARCEYYSFDADIFALGVVLFEMIAGYCLFGTEVINPKPKFGESISTLTKDIDWSFLSNSLDISTELIDLISGMLQFKVEKRLNIDQILEHAFFKLDFDPPVITPSQQPVPYDSNNEISPNVTDLGDMQPIQQAAETVEEHQQPIVQITQPEVVQEELQQQLVVEPIRNIYLERDEPTPTTFSEFVSFSYERVGLPQDYTRVSIIKDEIGPDLLVRTEKIGKSKHSKVLVLLSSDSNKAFNYSIKVLESPNKHSQTGTVSSSVEYELEEIGMEMINLEFELSHCLTSRWLSYFSTQDQIPFTIEIYVQTKVPEHSSILSIE